MFSSSLKIYNSKLNNSFSKIIPQLNHRICKFHVSKSCAKFDSTEEKQRKILNKLLRLPKKKINSSSQIVDVIPGAKLDFSETSKRNSRRKFVLEALFMDHITSLIASEEIAEELSKYPLEITNVKVSSNYNNVNVWWNSSDFKNLKDISKILEENSGKIRSLLTARNIMGRIPHISFVLDKQSNKLSEVEHALSKADFGPDFEYNPTPYLGTFKPPKTARSLEDLVNQNFEALKGNHDKSKEWKEELNIPSDMKQNIFGLDHSKMMAEIMVKKQKRIHKHNSSENTSCTTSSTINVDNSTNDRALVFKEFIKQRKIEQKKKSRKSIINQELESMVMEEAYMRQNEIWDSNYEENDVEDYDEESE